MPFSSSLTGPVRGVRPGVGRRLLALTAAAAGCLLATAPSVLADTRVAIQTGDFGAGASGRVLRIVEERDLFANEPMRVSVTPAATGNVLVADSAGKVTAGAGCQLLSTGDARCSGAGLTGMLLQGTNRADRLDNDTGVPSRLEGRAGNDALDGGDANDHLEGEDGDDTLDGRGGPGDRVIYSGSDTPVAVTLGDAVANDGGTAEDDNLVNIENVVGSRFADRIIGSGAANVLDGGGGNDTVDGGAGDDLLDEGRPLSGSDDLIGGAGIDRVSYLGRDTGVGVTLNAPGGDGSQADDTATRDNVRPDIENVRGTDRNDVLTGDGGANELDGRGGEDRLDGLGGDDRMIGGVGGDQLNGSDGDDTLSGGDGIDRLTGLAGRDTLRGEAGDDNLDGGTEDDVLEGGLDEDDLSGADGADRLLGGSDRDELSGGRGGDLLDGGGGVDGDAIVDYARDEDVRVTIDPGTSDVVDGTVGDDGGATDGPPGQRDTVISIETIRTGTGNDDMRGTRFAETFFGGPGDDTIIAGGGDDDLHGDNPPEVPFLPGEQPGVDELDAGEGQDHLFSKDGLVDEIRCGLDLNPQGTPLEPVFQSRDRLSSDLADVLTPHPESRLDDCEEIDAEAVGELPGARIASRSLRIGRRGRARIVLRCPAETLTDGCAGRLSVATRARSNAPAGAASYRLENGRTGKVSLRLSRSAARRLVRRKIAHATATEHDRAGRPKATSTQLRVKPRTARAR
jgi:Ca2+-binding RTX toxin-like protein